MFFLVQTLMVPKESDQPASIIRSTPEVGGCGLYLQSQTLSNLKGNRGLIDPTCASYIRAFQWIPSTLCGSRT